MTKVYEVWCEWDIGQENVVFSTGEKAWEFIEKRCDQYNLGIPKELSEDGWIGIDAVDVDPEN